MQILLFYPILTKTQEHGCLSDRPFSLLREINGLATSVIATETSKLVSQ